MYSSVASGELRAPRKIFSISELEVTKTQVRHEVGINNQQGGTMSGQIGGGIRHQRLGLALRLLVAGALLAPGLPRGAAAATIRVPADQPSIQDAIDAAGPGDTVLIAPGTYAENLIVAKGDLVLKGAGAETTIVDGQAAGRVLLIEGQSGVAVEGLTLRNGLGSGYDFDGGGILVQDSGDIAIRRCRILGNRVVGANADGGGISIKRSTGAVLVEGSTVSGNRAENWGGGVNLQGANGVRIEGSAIRGNRATVGAGMALYSAGLGASATLAGNRIADNRGTGIYLDSACTLVLGGSSAEANELPGNTDYAFANRSGNAVEARFNYWGTESEPEIQAAIYDGQDEPGLGTLLYAPWGDRSVRPRDLSLGLAAVPRPVLPGQGLAYQASVTNAGPSTASSVVLADTLPAEATFVSATSPQGTCTHLAGRVTCRLGWLNAGASATATISVLAPTLPAILHNRATVEALGQDLDPADNRATLATPAGNPPLAASISPTPLVSQTGLPQDLLARYRDPDGAGNLRSVDLRVGAANTPAGAIWARYRADTNRLYLCDDGGVLLPGGCEPGAAETLENGQGLLHCAGSAAVAQGNVLRVQWRIEPKAGFAGSKWVYLQAIDRQTLGSGWHRKGSWQIDP
jgi:uncharacterized repeat protein (TIGR01451 family)